MINGRTRLHVVANGTMTGQRYIDEVLLPHVRLFRGAVGDKFVFMDDNATCHRTLAVQDCLDSEVAGRNYPPTNKNTLIRALAEEWDKLPQQLLDNVVQSMAVQRKSRLQCKCHGVSGSCASRTCWKVQTDFGEVGRLLKKRYEGAVQVTVDNQNTLMSLEGRKPFSKLDLVYFEHSPDYCTPNKSIGTLGTGGRRCVKDSMGSEGCDILCCGRGYDTRRELFVEKCGCKFDWCCKVQCKVCREMKDVYTCKMQYKT
ncbi:protein Wnt-2b [Trichonephila clavipes]|nr:protein Wnt-2b [Trichonephila clavipes]